MQGDLFSPEVHSPARCRFFCRHTLDDGLFAGDIMPWKLEKNPGVFSTYDPVCACISSPPVHHTGIHVPGGCIAGTDARQNPAGKKDFS
jgi:hypothetical protein